MVSVDVKHHVYLLTYSQVNGTRISLDHLAPTTAFALGETESDELCRSLPRMTEDSWIVLPSDRLMLTWASEDGESEMEVGRCCLWLSL